MVHIGHSKHPTIKISDPCKDSLGTWAKSFALKLYTPEYVSKFKIMPESFITESATEISLSVED